MLHRQNRPIGMAIIVYPEKPAGASTNRTKFPVIRPTGQNFRLFDLQAQFWRTGNRHQTHQAYL